MQIEIEPTYLYDSINIPNNEIDACGGDIGMIQAVIDKYLAEINKTNNPWRTTNDVGTILEYLYDEEEENPNDLWILPLP